MCEDAIVLKNPIPQVDDFTDYLESTSEEVKRLPALAKVAPNENLLAYDFDAVIKSSRNGPPQPKKAGRAADGDGGGASAEAKPSSRLQLLQGLAVEPNNQAEERRLDASSSCLPANHPKRVEVRSR